MAEQEFNSRMMDAQALRDRADHYRAVSLETNDPWLKMELLRIVRAYEEEAVEVETQLQDQQ